MKTNLIPLIVLAWIGIGLLVDIFVSMSSGSIQTTPVKILISAEFLLTWIALQNYRGKKWALISLLAVFAIASFNIYTEAFSFYTKTGLNIEIGINKVIGINLLSLLILVLLIIQLKKR